MIRTDLEGGSSIIGIVCQVLRGARRRKRFCTRREACKIRLGPCQNIAAISHLSSRGHETEPGAEAGQDHLDAWPVIPAQQADVVAVEAEGGLWQDQSDPSVDAFQPPPLPVLPDQA